ncbi:MAG: hypothetical protein KAG66_17815, partial [Methylococcales bacterium]|nr:hypothetical protein [Methylococcales bacterium]
MLFIDPQRRLTGLVIEYAYNLQAIGCPSARLDNIDVNIAHDLGVQICNVPDGNAVAIAEHTMTRLLMTATRFSDGHLAGKTLGLIGFGPVSAQVVKRARAFSMKILVNQPRPTPQMALYEDIASIDLVDLLQQSDFISLHVPYKAETDTIIGVDELALMKPSAFLINTGHTHLVDEAALLDCLGNGRIAGAALSELPANSHSDVETVNPLRQHDRVMVSPHVSTIIRHKQDELAVTVAHKLITLLEEQQASQSL